MEKEYVLGFAFSKDTNHIVLILKDRPDWQKGKLNGVGGKIESSDYTDMPTYLKGHPFGNWIYAMNREFLEETGVDIIDWDYFCRMEFKNDLLGGTAIVYCFRTFTDTIFQCKTMESEQVGIFTTEHIAFPTCPNVPLLINMALNKGLFHARLEMH